MSFLYYFMLFGFVIVSLLLCGVILIQESKTMGLGASFGGDAGSSLFGTATASVVKKITAWLAFLFFFGCIMLSFWTSSLSNVGEISPYSTTADDLIEGQIQQ